MLSGVKAGGGWGEGAAPPPGVKSCKTQGAWNVCFVLVTKGLKLKKPKC